MEMYKGVYMKRTNTIYKIAIFVILLLCLHIISSRSFAAPVLAVKATSKSDSSWDSTLKQARQFYKDKKFEKAITLYKKIPSTYVFWVDSLEERAWAHMQLGQFESALSLYHTLSAEALSSQVGPETHLVGAISSLRICDYKSVFEEVKLFRDRFKERVSVLNKLNDLGTSEYVEKAFERIKNKDKALAFAPIEKFLPRYTAIDQILRDKVFKADLQSAQKRIQTLAASDIKEIAEVTKKMRIIEIEAIQRMGLNRKAEGDRVQLSKVDSDYLVFPKENEEWLDETRYQVAARHCAQTSSQTNSQNSQKSTKQ